MKVHLIAVGERPPRWVDEAAQDYAGRLGGRVALELVSVAAERRSGAADGDRAKREEASRLLAAIPDGARVIALDQRGRQWTTRQLAQRMDNWLMEGRDVALVIGGADGLHGDVLGRADGRWSLSKLTLPHMLVRVIVAEQIYRAWSILAGHPYHR